MEVVLSTQDHARGQQRVFFSCCPRLIIPRARWTPSTVGSRRIPYWKGENSFGYFGCSQSLRLWLKTTSRKLAYKATPAAGVAPPKTAMRTRASLASRQQTSRQSQVPGPTPVRSAS